jgi:hypothetical protein
MEVEASHSTGSVTRDEVEHLVASDQELPRRAGLALKTLLDDLAKAQAAAASTAINTGLFESNLQFCHQTLLAILLLIQLIISFGSFRSMNHDHHTQ